MFHGHLDNFQKPPLGGKSNTKPGDHGTLNTHNRWCILFHHAWGPAWIEIHWNSIRLRACSHMTSHYTWGSVTTPHDFGGVLRQPLDTFFWALTISWSRLLARVWSGPKVDWVRSKVHGGNDQGEPAVSYRWTGWVGEITGWSSRLQENYRSF